MRPSTVQIVPSVLPCDYGILGEELSRLEIAGVDKIQWDVMDGHFVPNLTFGPDLIRSARKYSSLPFEAHLMITEPESSMEHYLEAGCELLIIHAESTRHLHRTLSAARAMGARVGVALNPSTEETFLRYLLQLVDLVLVMTVNPGFGGQAYISEMEGKIASVAKMIDESGLPIDLEVDGGISTKTVAGAAGAGANHLVAGSYLYNSGMSLSDSVKDLRAKAEDALLAASARRI